MNFFKKYYAILTALFVFLIYMLTFAPSVVEIDAGELATVQATLGIAHPTGYPLFTMIGYLFSLIPLPMTKIMQLNMLAAIWCSLGAGLFAYTVKFMLDNLSSFSIPKKLKAKVKAKKNKTSSSRVKPKKKDEDIPDIKKYLTAILGALILAFDKTYWAQSTSVEVYSLQVFLFILIILFVFKAYVKSSADSPLSFKSPWMIVAIVLSFGFSNHMTTLFLLPGIAYLYFNKFGFNKKSYKQIGMMLLIFIPLLILFYSYLPIRAAQKPLLNWGNPVTLAKLFRHVKGEQYQVWLFSSTKAAEKQFSYFMQNLPTEFWVSTLFAVIGLFTAFIRARKFFFFGVTTFAFTVLYAINYDIHDIDSYFLLAYISLSFFAVFGIVQIFKLLKLKKYTYLIPAGLVVLFIAVQAFLNFRQVNQSDVYIFEDYTKNILKYSGKNSIIMSYEWDYFVAATYYFQYVEHYRPDVTIVDKELLRRSWYYAQLNNDHPKLFAGMKNDVNAFLKAVAPFESNGNFNPDLLERCYRTVMTDIVRTNVTKRDVYIAPEIFDVEMQRGQFTLPAGYTLVPELFNFKVVKGNSYVPAPDPDFKIRLPEERNYYINFIENTVASMLARRALYEMQFDRVNRAKLYINKIRTDFPDYILPEGLEQVLDK